MEKVLIVFAHPEAQSFCAALKEKAAAHLREKGADVHVLDLYEMKFNPVGGKHDFKEFRDPEFFKYQMEQVNAWENDLFAPEIKQHMDEFLWCDSLVFVFPLWWFGLPAMLKGWVDRVFAMGLTYGAGKGVYDNGAFPEKTGSLIFTTGGPEIAYGPNGKNGELETILFPVHHGMFYFTGMTVLPPFISFGPARSSQEERIAELERLERYLDSRDQLTPLYTNRK